MGIRTMTAPVTVRVQCETWEQTTDRAADLWGEIEAAGGRVIEASTRAAPPRITMTYYPGSAPARGVPVASHD